MAKSERRERTEISPRPSFEPRDSNFFSLSLILLDATALAAGGFDRESRGPFHVKPSSSSLPDNPPGAPSGAGAESAASARPRVSVCLPVYQGETFIADAIRSILDQSFSDLELVISDNASTDGTEAICRRIAAEDCRVRYVRAEKNQGLAWNHNRAFELSRGEFALWIGHDDRLEPTHLERCVAELDRRPDAVLCYTSSNDIDVRGQVTARVDLPTIGDSDRPSDRYSEAVQYEKRCDVVLGLMRSSALRQTTLHGGYHGSDWALVAELALLGRFVHVRDHLFSRRKHLQQASRRNDRWQNTVIFDPRKAGKTTYPFLCLLRGFRRAIGRAPIGFIEKQRCHRHLLKFAWRTRHHITGDLKVGFATSVKRRLSDRQVDRVRRLKHQLFGS